MRVRLSQWRAGCIQTAGCLASLHSWLQTLLFGGVNCYALLTDLLAKDDLLSYDCNCGLPRPPCRRSRQSFVYDILVPHEDNWRGAVNAGSEMQPARAPVQGERKIVTVLFADIVDSTALAEDLDPEEWAEIIGGMHARVSESIARFDGLVAQLLGDGVLAFFGAPTAHEDDPERAVRSALDLMDAIAAYETTLRQTGVVPRFQLRIGLNTGLVVVGQVGAGAHVEYLAVGDTVNLAARMQGASEPGTILMTENTAREVRHAFDLVALGEVDIKGKSGQVPVYRVLGPKAQVASKRGIAGLGSPIVGREREIELLSGRLRGLAAGQGQIIALVGEAGLGKSRLVAEIVQGSPEAFARAEGRCLSFASTQPYLPLKEALTGLLDLPTLEDGESRMGRLRDRLSAAEVPFIGTLLGLPLRDDELEAVRYTGLFEPGRARQRMIDAIVAAFEHLARQQPLALIIEDLHWADPSTLDVLERLLPAAGRTPLGIVVAFRPGAHEPSWRFHEVASREHAEHYTPLFLQPLSEADAGKLVANLLYIEGLPETVRRLILAKAEGNPFYVEEVIRSLLDAHLIVHQDDRWRATQEIATITLPDSLTGVITARLDRLDESTKQVAQTAAVLGRDFAVSMLAQLVEPSAALPQALDQLVARGLVQARGMDGYRFKHVLTQEAAYNSLLLGTRRGLHRRAAQILAGSEGSPPATIATHFLSAQEPQLALPYLLAAGEEALAAYSTQEALALYRQALPIATAGDDASSARRAFEGLGAASRLAFNPPAALETYRAMEVYAQEHGDDSMRVSALNKAAYVESMWLGDFVSAERQLNQAGDLAQACNDRAGLAEGLVTRCNVETGRADFERAVEHLGQLVQIGRNLEREFETAFGLVHTANTWTYLARFDRAWPAAQEARNYAQDHNDLFHLAQALASSVPWCHLSNGDLPAAYTAADEAVAICRRISENIGLTQGAYMLATIARLRGDYAEALRHLQVGLAAAQELGLPFIVAMMLGAICGTSVEMDPARLEGTLEMHRQALQLLEHPMGLAGGSVAWADLGECALLVGQLDPAREMFEKGLAAHTPFMYLQRPRLLLDLARVDLETHDEDAARQHITAARSFIDEHQMGWQEPLVDLAEAEINAVFEQKEAALSRYQAALAGAAGMAMRPAMERARRGAAALGMALG